MPVILCQHCHEPWDTDTLIDDAVGMFDVKGIDHLAPLNSLIDVGTHAPEPKRDRMVAVLAPLGDPNWLVTIAATFWWASDRPESDPLTVAAKALVGATVRLAVERGLGCPDCGFDHTPPSPQPEKES